MRIPAVGFAAPLLLMVVAACDAPTAVTDDAPRRAPVLLQPLAASVGEDVALDRRFVTFTAEGVPADLEEEVAALGGTVVRRLDAVDAAVVEGLDAEVVGALPGVLSVTDDLVATWEPDAQVVALDEAGPEAAGIDPTNAFFFPIQWNMRRIRADRAWRSGLGDPAVKVAVLDGGVNPTHFDMQGRVDPVLSKNLLSFTPCGFFGETLDPANWDDYRYHGTHVAGTIASNGLGTAAVAPDVSIVAVKVLACNGRGSFGDVIAGILYAAEIGVDVINMSLGATVPNDPVFQPLFDALHDAIQEAVDAGALVVVSAGNSSLGLRPLDEDDDGEYDGDDEEEGGPAFLVVPAQSHPLNLIVSATAPRGQQHFDRPASYTNFGEDVISLSAPGGDFQVGVVQDLIIAPCSPSSIFFGCSGLSYLFLGGTSMAAPHVAGAAALLDSHYGGALTGRQLRNILLDDGVDEREPERFHGEGRLNVASALDELDDDDDDDEEDGG